MRFLTLFLTAATLWAHHSIEKEFDRPNQTTYRATVEKIIWQNPHVLLTAKVAEQGKAPGVSQVTWTFEMSSPNALPKYGFAKDFVKPGDVVTIQAFKAKDGSPRATLLRVTWPDGRTKEDKGAWSNWMPADQVSKAGGFTLVPR
jgi:hypothetical protein